MHGLKLLCLSFLGHNPGQACSITCKQAAISTRAPGGLIETRPWPLPLLHLAFLACRNQDSIMGPASILLQGIRISLEDQPIAPTKAIVCRRTSFGLLSPKIPSLRLSVPQDTDWKGSGVLRKHCRGVACYIVQTKSKTRTNSKSALIIDKEVWDR